MMSDEREREKRRERKEKTIGVGEYVIFDHATSPRFSSSLASVEMLNIDFIHHLFFLTYTLVLKNLRDLNVSRH